MYVLILTMFAFSLPIFSQDYAYKHSYDFDVVALIDFEEDICLDDHLYHPTDLLSQVYIKMKGQSDKPDKLLQQAAYAFDSFKYNKCLEKIKEYERVNYPPPYDYPSLEEKLTILAFKAYSKKYLKKYDSAIDDFEAMIDIIKRIDYLEPECKFVTYFEHAHCYLMKGDSKEFQRRIKKIVDLEIAPKYEYYVKNNFKINHQPCFHNHELNQQECMIFKEIAPNLLGKELYAILEAKGEIPKIYTVADNSENKEHCRRRCARASYLCAIIIGCIAQKPLAIAATWALSELLIDCETCCAEGWGSKNCCKDIKQAFEQVCQQHMLDGL